MVTKPLLRLWLFLLVPCVARAETRFNDEVMRRVIGRLEDFMHFPVESCQRVANYREFGGFKNDMKAADRDSALTALYAELGRSKVYYGLEDGLFLYFSANKKNGWYREPGESGYNGTNVPEEMKKNWNTCINGLTGQQEPCVLDEGASYVQCLNGCDLEICPDKASQEGCTHFLYGDERRECEAGIKWCPQYAIEQVKLGEKKRGYVPATTRCLNPYGQFEQAPGKVLVDADTGALGDCLYGDGKTRVERSLPGAYEYCGGNGTVCDNTFVGAYSSLNYDPRYRSWYKLAKTEQKPIWSEPYKFFTDLEIGITYTHPIYTTKDHRRIFSGVLAVDYALSIISDFLQTEYKGMDILVGIFEDAEPYYVIGTSTGSQAARTALSYDSSMPCPDDASDDLCQAVRLTIDDLGEHPDDLILQRTFAAHNARDFPDGEFVASKESDDIDSPPYISKGQVYEQKNANLKWRVIVTLPIERSDNDAALPGGNAFFFICVFGCLGVVLCFGVFVVFCRHKDDPSVAHNNDGLLTCAFLLGCSALNLSTLTFLGPNIAELCMLRMWSYNFLLICAVTPLFIKAHRTYMLHFGGPTATSRPTLGQLVSLTYSVRHVESEGEKMTPLRVLLMMMPFLVVELVILTIFSIIDPPKPRERLEESNEVFLQHLYCGQDTRSFFWSQVVFCGLLICVGCVMAFLTRNMDARYGEEKQASFATYNFGFTTVLIATIVEVLEMEQSSRMILRSIGTFWATLFGAFAFILPFLIGFNERDPEHCQ